MNKNQSIEKHKQHKVFIIQMFQRSMIGVSFSTKLITENFRSISSKVVRITLFLFLTVFFFSAKIKEDAPV